MFKKIVHFKNSKSNTLNWQVLKVEDKDLETKGDFSLPEVYEELTKLSEIITTTQQSDQAPHSEDSLLLAA